MSRPVLVVALLGSVLLCALALGMRLLAEARAARDAAVDARNAAAEAIAELARLRQEPSVVATSRRPDEALLGDLQEALKQQGLVVDQVLGGCKPRGEQRLGDGDLAVQQVQVQLTDLAPHELGAFLAAFRQRSPAWRVAEIQLGHRREAGAGGPARPGRAPGPAPAGHVDPNRYDAMLLLAAPYLARPTGPGQGPEPLGDPP